MEEELNENSTENSKKSVEHLQPYQFKKGQSGNPGGRPAGKSLKEYTREMLAAMNEDERQTFLHGLPKQDIWKMSEGNPETKSEVKQETTIMPMLVKFLNIKDDKTDNSGDTDRVS